MKKFNLIPILIVLTSIFVLSGCMSSKDALNKYVSAVQGKVKEQKSDDLDISLTTKGENTAVMRYTINEALSTAEIDTMKTTIDNGLQSQKDAFNDMLAEMKSSKIKDPVVQIEYVDKNGSVIYSKEFK